MRRLGRLYSAGSSPGNNFAVLERVENRAARAGKLRPPTGRLRQDLADDASGLDAGQLGLKALEVVGEPLVVDAEEVQARGLEVSDVYPVFNDVVGELVGFAIHDAAFDAAARHPEAEAARVMVAAVVGRGELALGVDRPPELAAPDDESIFEEASVFEILDEGEGRAVDVPRLGGKHLGRELMDVPPAVIDLDEPDAALELKASRRAMSAVFWNVPGSLASSPHRSKVLSGSLPRSAISGTEDCMRKAISYCAIRAKVSGLPIFSCWI